MNKIILILFILMLIPSTSASNLSKQWDLENNTLIINDIEGLVATIQLISKIPDLITFEEVFNLTAYVNYTFDNLKDFKTRWNIIEGNNNITKIEWYILKNLSYEETINDYGLVKYSQVIPNITSYTNITDTWNLTQILDTGDINSKLKYKFNFSYNGTYYNDTISGFDYWDVITTNPLKVKIFWNKTEIIGNHTVLKYKNEWILFNSSGKSIEKGESYLLKLVYYKEAEIGNINIQTIPMFMGIEENNMTWWDNSWQYKTNSQIANGARPYLLYLNISNTVGINNNTHVFCNGHCNTGFSDLRFTLDNVTLLPYYIEDNTLSQIRLWVNLTQNGTVNMYYGNPSAVSLSNSVTTFPFFDNFSDLNYNGWTVQSGTWSAASGYLQHTSNTAAWEGISTPFNLSNAVWEFDLAHGGDSAIFKFIDQSGNSINSNSYMIYLSTLTSQNYLYETPSGTIHLTFSRNGDVMEHYTVRRNSTGNFLVYNSTYIGTATDTTWTSSSFLSMWGYNAGQKLDNITVRYYTETEPAWATWDAEESNIVTQISNEIIYIIII